MRSSTSNFKKPIRALGTFGLVFAGITLLGFWLANQFPSICWKGQLPPIPLNDHYIVSEAYSDQSPDLYAQYYGIGPQMKNARKADILIVGNSKPYFAFRANDVKAFTQKTGIKVFNLSVPYGDGYAMAKALIEHNNLHPTLLLINENHFFKSDLSPYAKETLKMGYWQALYRVFENTLSWDVKSTIAFMFPKWGLGKIYGSTPIVQYRSTENGCLAAENFSQTLVPVAQKGKKQEELTSEELNNAHEFLDEMKKRGTEVILISVPYGTDDPNHIDHWVKDPEKRAFIARAEEPYERIDKLGRELGLKTISLNPSGLRTFDGRHLDINSSKIYTASFFIFLDRMH